MKCIRLELPIISFFVGIFLLSACLADHKQANSGAAKMSSFSIDELQLTAGSTAWNSVDIVMQTVDGAQIQFKRSIAHSSFSNDKSEDLSIKVPLGNYTINLIYKDQKETVVYQVCSDVRDKNYAINSSLFRTDIRICAEDSGKSVGTVSIDPSSQGAIIAQTGEQTPPPSTGTPPPPSTGTPPPPSTGTTPPPIQPNGSCIQPNYGFASTPAPGSRIQYDNYSGPLSLPSLSVTASNAEIKAFVVSVYDAFPLFKQVFEAELGLSKKQALAFMYADISRETSSGERWRINLETGVGGPGHAWGPFQAAVTNFTGGGYDKDIARFTGLPVPAYGQFFDPSISSYAGMKRLAEGVLKSIRDFGPGKPAKIYLLGTLADHNTGYPSSISNEPWLKDYGNEVLRLMQGYLYGTNLTNDRAFWTYQPEKEICR